MSKKYKEDPRIVREHTGRSGEDGNDFKRLRQIKLMVSPSEFEKMIAGYEKSPYTNLATYCREKVLASPRKVASTIEIKKVFTENLYLFQRTSSNINQIARKVNTEKGSYGQLLSDLQNELDEIKRVHIQLLKKVSGLD